MVNCGGNWAGGNSPGSFCPCSKRPGNFSLGCPGQCGKGADSPLPLNSLLAVQSAQPPVWVTTLNHHLQPLAAMISILYVIGDAVLLIIAATLLVAFWGGRSSQAWILIALAAFSLYIADMFFAYAANTNTYVEGSLWEVFWSFSAIFFWLGAVVERAVSIHSRHSPRHRKA